MATIYAERTEHSAKPVYFGTQVVWYIAGVIEAILALRFVLRLVGANAAAGFTDLVYSISGVFVAPFVNIVRNAQVQGSVFDWNTLIAMAVYWMLAWGIVRLFFINRPVGEIEARTEIHHENE